MEKTHSNGSTPFKCHYDEAVTCLNLHPRVLSALRKAKLNTVKSVLLLSGSDLVRRCGLSHSDVADLIAATSQGVFHNSIHNSSVLHLYKQKHNSPNHGRLSTGCVSLDQVLRGGLLVPGINEIAGMSAAGKTQLCLQLCLTVQLPTTMGGLDGSAVYVSTEDAFPSKRWQQLATCFALRHAPLGLTVDKLSNNLYIEHAATVSALSVQLQYKLPSLLSQHPVKLVVLDSLAALFRVEYAAHQTIQRAKLLREFGHRLKILSEKYSAAIVCVNQVTAAMDNQTVQGPAQASLAAIKPALGLTWADMVTTRLMLTRPEGVDANEEFQKFPKRVPRTLQILLSPHLPQASVQYYIDTDGIKGYTAMIQPLHHNQSDSLHV